MKLTKQQLKQIIKEELEAVLSEEPIEESYSDAHYEQSEQECSDMIQQMVDSGELAVEDAGRAFNECVLSKRPGGV